MRKLNPFFRNSALLFLYASIILVLATVFIIDNRLVNGVVTGKYFWFYWSAGLVCMASSIYDLIAKQIFRFSLIDGLVLLFFGSVFLTSLALNDVSWKATKIAILALLLVLYFAFRWITGSNRQKLHNLLCLFICITGLVEAVWGLLQLYDFLPSQHNLFKLTGSFFNPGPYAGYLAVVFPMALHLYLQRQGCRCYYKWVSGITCLAIILVLPAAISRASWLAVLAGCLVVVGGRWDYVAVLKKFLYTGKMKISALVFASCLFVAALGGMYYLKKDSADGRMLTWKVSLTALAQHPFGVGLGRFPGAYGDAQADYFASGKGTETEEFVAGNPEYGFNEFLQTGIESGVVSLILFVSVIGCTFWSLAKSKRWGLMGSLMALVVFACFSYPFSVLTFLILLVFLVAMSVPENFYTQMTRIERILTNKQYALFRWICVNCLVAVVIWVQCPVYKANLKWKDFQMFYRVGKYEEVTNKYETLYPYLNDKLQFMFEYGRSLSQLEQPEKSNEVLRRAMRISCDPILYNIMGKNYQTLKEYGLAEKSLLKASHIVPNRIYPHYLLMKLYLETGDVGKAKDAARIVLTKEPKVQSTAVREMREEARKIVIKN